MKAFVAGVLAALALSVAGVVAWQWSVPPKPVGGDSVASAPAPAVKRAPRVRVPVSAPIETIQGGAKANLKLPPAVQADERQQVIAATQVKPEVYPQTVSTVLNTETGVSETFVKRDPQPWLAVEGRGELSLAYGYKLDAATRTPKRIARFQAKYDAVRVKAFTLGLVASVDSDHGAFVGVQLTYRW